MFLWETIAQRLSAATGRSFEFAGQSQLGGGSINRATVVQGRDGRRYFVKFNRRDALPMFEAEAEGLRELARTATLRVPIPVNVGNAENEAFLILEYLELTGVENSAQLGRGLAALHRTTQSRFGWHRDNTIGSTPQINTWNDDWVVFFREQRLAFQLRFTDGALRELGEQLLERLPIFFRGYRPIASLLHGDLWSGNTGATRDGAAVIFDPAVYYGDREADIAMTELFGGFAHAFYDAYREAWPLDAGYATRKTLYNLYHVLNHHRLFGGGYATQAGRMMRQLLSEAR